MVGCSTRNFPWVRSLTPQPFLPKLRLSKHMPGKSSRFRLLALFLGIIFLAAQFHFCTDLTSDPTSSHLCPLCTAAGSAIVTASPSVAIVPVMDRLENLARVGNISVAPPRATSPRAPPSC